MGRRLVGRAAGGLLFGRERSMARLPRGCEFEPGGRRAVRRRRAWRRRRRSGGCAGLRRRAGAAGRRGAEGLLDGLHQAIGPERLVQHRLKALPAAP